MTVPGRGALQLDRQRFGVLHLPHRAGNMFLGQAVLLLVFQADRRNVLDVVAVVAHGREGQVCAWVCPQPHVGAGRNRGWWR